jgi:hypothetical protein
MQLWIWVKIWLNFIQIWIFWPVKQLNLDPIFSEFPNFVHFGGLRIFLAFESHNIGWDHWSHDKPIQYLLICETVELAWLSVYLHDNRWKESNHLTLGTQLHYHHLLYMTALGWNLAFPECGFWRWNDTVSFSKSKRLISEPDHIAILMWDP